jgi:hypothetical protein
MPRSHPIGVATTYGLWLLVVDAGAELFYSSVAIVVLRSSVVVDGGTCYAMFLGGI